MVQSHLLYLDKIKRKTLGVLYVLKVNDLEVFCLKNNAIAIISDGVVLLHMLKLYSLHTTIESVIKKAQIIHTKKKKVVVS